MLCGLKLESLLSIIKNIIGNSQPMNLHCLYCQQYFVLKIEVGGEKSEFMGETGDENSEFMGKTEGEKPEFMGGNNSSIVLSLSEILTFKTEL